MTNGDVLRKAVEGDYRGKTDEEIIDALSCACDICPATSFCASPEFDSVDPSKAPIPCSTILRRWLKKKKR